MWRLVNEGLRVYRPVLLVAWAVAAAGVVFVFVTLTLLGVFLADRAVLYASSAFPMYLLLASAIPGWIALGADTEEKRMHLHLLLPIPLREVALAHHVLPVAMLAIGLVVAHVLNAAARALFDTPTLWLAHSRLDLIAAYLFFFTALSFGYQEVATFWERSRILTTVGSVFLSFLCVIVVLSLFPLGGFLKLAAGVAVVSVLLLAACVASFCRRLRS